MLEDGGDLVMLDDAFAQSGDLGQLTGIGDAVVDDGSDSLKIADVAIDGFFGMLGLVGNRWSQEALEVESNDFSFVGDGS